MGCCGQKHIVASGVTVAPPKQLTPEFLAEIKQKHRAQHERNLLDLALQQQNVLKWLKDGIIGNAKYYVGDADFSPEDIDSNRDHCLGCEFRSGRPESPNVIRTIDQCLGPDPAQGGAPCGCPIFKKIVTGRCPVGKWTSTPLTVKQT